MPYERNIETQDALKRDVKALQADCINVCHIIENAPPDNPSLSSEEILSKTNYYIEGLRTEIQNSNVPIITDANLLTSQFLHEIRQKSKQVEELTAFMRGSVHDIDAEINRLNSLLRIAQEAKSKPRMEKNIVCPDHIKKAKERFSMMKSELHELIHSLFPSSNHAMIEVLGQLMSAKLNTSSASDYIPITTENYQVIELLRDNCIVVANPYNKMEVKLAY